MNQPSPPEPVVEPVEDERPDDGVDTVLAIPVTVDDTGGPPVIDVEALAVHIPAAITDPGDGNWPTRYTLLPVIPHLWLAVHQLADRVTAIENRLDPPAAPPDALETP